MILEAAPFRVSEDVTVSENSKNPNLFILKKDSSMGLYKEIPLAQIFVDLWNLKEWYAREFVNAMEEKLEI